jgi:hypothetical protein
MALQPPDPVRNAIYHVIFAAAPEVGKQKVTGTEMSCGTRCSNRKKTGVQIATSFAGLGDFAAG